MCILQISMKIKTYYNTFKLEKKCQKAKIWKAYKVKVEKLVSILNNNCSW